MVKEGGGEGVEEGSEWEGPVELAGHFPEGIGCRSSRG
jgi:hypothetical protein